MRSLVATGDGGLSIVEGPGPTATPLETVVAPLLSGVCGTDLELIDATIDPAYVRYPLTLGHEWVGELLEDVRGIGVAGERVVVEGIVPCEECVECRRGDTNRCVTYDEIGFTRPGSIAEMISVPTRLIHRIDATVELDDAVLVEPMAVVWRALNRIALRPGLRVAVVGDGTVALLAAYMVRLFDPSSVVVVGRRAAQRTLAMRAGADDFVVVPPKVDFDLVIEAAGNADAVRTAIDLTARGGELILLGLAAHGTTVEVAPDDLVNNDLIVQGSFSYTRRSWSEVVERVNSADLRPSFLITHRFTMDEWPSAIESLRGGVAEEEPRGKVVITIERQRRPEAN